MTSRQREDRFCGVGCGDDPRIVCFNNLLIADKISELAPQQIGDDDRIADVQVIKVTEWFTISCAVSGD